jgi:ubiquitin carboxyl-terminal hydrolase 25/28
LILILDTKRSLPTELLEFAYNHQNQCDPQHTPLYFGALSLLVNEILPALKPESAVMNPDRDGLLTDSLQIMYTSERSKNRWTPGEFDAACSELGFGMDNDLKLDIEDVEADFVGKAYTDAVARTYSTAYTMSVASWINTTSIDTINEGKRKILRDALRVAAEGLGDVQLYELWKKAGNYGFMDPNKAYLTLDVPAETTDEMLMMVYQMRVSRGCLAVP